MKEISVGDVLYLAPTGLPDQLKISSANHTRVELTSEVGDYSLDCKEAPECLIFKKIVQQNSKGERRIVYQKVACHKIHWIEPQRFSDFQYESKVKKEDLIDFFEGNLN